MPDLDLVLKHGILYDGTGGDPLRGDIGVRGGRIAAIDADLTGHETLDCEGLCVAPGFIDTCARDDLAALARPTLESKVRQGITLALVGQDGVGVAPLRSGDVEARREALAFLLGRYDIDWPWRSLASYLDALDQARPALDLACLVPHGAIRTSILGTAEREAVGHDLFRMKGLLARSLDEGAWGFSVGFRHPPGCYASKHELVELSVVAASRYVPLVAGLRSEGELLLESARELIELGRESGARLHLAHLALGGEESWPLLPRLLEIFGAARAGGVGLTVDLAPYTSDYVPLAALLPAWVTADGPRAVSARLSSLEERQRIRAQLLAPQSAWCAYDASQLHLSSLPSSRSDLAGKDLAAAAAGADPIDFALDLLREEPAATVVCRNQSEEVLEALLALPYANVGSGGLAAGAPHPRAWGAFPRVLSRYVRERGTLSLPQAVRKMTGLPADSFGFDDFGYVLEGKRANMVVFEADQARDLATLDEPARFCEGIRHVLVGGKMVVRDGSLTGERPGRVARRKRS